MASFLHCWRNTASSPSLLLDEGVETRAGVGTAAGLSTAGGVLTGVEVGVELPELILDRLAGRVRALRPESRLSFGLDAQSWRRGGKMRSNAD